MSFNNYLTTLPTGEDAGAIDPAQAALLSTRFNHNSHALHITFPPDQSDDASTSQSASSSPRSSLEEVTVKSRRHFVIHGPSCQPALECALRGRQGPEVAQRSVGLPRAHIITMPRDPVQYDVGALWARRLSDGPLVGGGDRVWLEGVGEVVLREPASAEVSRYWKFFDAYTANYQIIEMAVEWKHVRLTPEECECHTGCRFFGRGVGPANTRQESFLDLEEGGWFRGWFGSWRGFRARFVAIFPHRPVDQAV